MRYSGYGVPEFTSLTEPRKRPRPEPKGPAGASLSPPQGVSGKEATFFLEIFARLKEKRFGRVEVTVREGNVTGVEFVERVDRNLLRSFSRLISRT